MKNKVSDALKVIGIFLSGGFTGILVFMIWAEHQGCLVASPSLRFEVMAGIPIAFILTIVPGLLIDMMTGVKKLKNNI